MLSPRDLSLLRFSLVFVWLATAFVSVWELHGQSLQLLAAAGVPISTFAFVVILGGAGVDVAIGLAMWIKPGRVTCLVALAMMAAMTVIATIVAPTLWLHPLGPLTKNVPIAVVLCLLARAQ